MSDLHPDSLDFQKVSDASIDALVEGLHGFMLASNLEVLANDDHIDGVSKVGVKYAGDVAVGEHFFDLECTGVESGHDGTRQRDWTLMKVLLFSPEVWK